jgi:hypothetical protein
MRRRALQLLLLTAFASSAALGQINCINNAHLVCEFPFASGSLSNSSGAASTGSALNIATGLNLAVASQLTQLPLATASAGTVLVYKNGVPETFSNLGPILVERAQTIGKHRIFLGATASQYVFTDIDGQPLRNLPFSYSSTALSGSTPVSTTYTQEHVQGSLVVDQFVAVATVGVTRKFDLSAIAPVTRVSAGANVPSSTDYVVSSSGSSFSSTGPTSTAKGVASGIGDVEIGSKYELYAGEHSTVSSGFILRLPTGSAENFLGSGAWGFNPYLAFSYLWKVAPHVKIGYQWNTASELNNPTYTNPIYSYSSSGAATIVNQPNKPIPGGVQYDVGGDWAMSKHFTAAIDLLGYQYLNSQQLINQTIVVSPAVPRLLSTTSQNSSYSINDLSTGLKWNPGRSLVFSANVLTQLINTGLRSRPTPLLGIAYKF